MTAARKQKAVTPAGANIDIDIDIGPDLAFMPGLFYKRGSQNPFPCYGRVSIIIVDVAVPQFAACLAALAAAPLILGVRLVCCVCLRSALCVWLLAMMHARCVRRYRYRCSALGTIYGGGARAYSGFSRFAVVVPVRVTHPPTPCPEGCFCVLGGAAAFGGVEERQRRDIPQVRAGDFV